MGNCCTWKNNSDGMGEMQMKIPNYPIDNMNNILNHDRTSNMFKISSFLIDKENIPPFLFKQELFYKNINDLINSSSNNKISTINIESLWNITKFHKQDFTNCNYILYDLRKKENKVENFLKKYKCINYNISEVKTFSGNKLRLFKNFIRNKNIIIIPKNQNINELKNISNFIDSLNDESLEQNQFFILTDLLNVNEDEIPDYFYNYKLYKKIDDKDFEIYPNILFQLSNIKYLNSYNYIYIQQKEFEASNYFKNEDFMGFINSMSIKLIIDIDDIYSYKEKPEKISYGSENAKNELLYFKINLKQYFNNDILNLFLYHLRYTFLSQGTLLIFYSEKINDTKELSKWLSYIISNSFFIYDGDGTMLSESEILIRNIQEVTPIYFQPKFVEDFVMNDIEENYTNRDYNTEINDSKQLDIIQGVKHLWKVKNEKNIFFEIICVIEKLILNIILNPGNEKYYKIKRTSRTIQNLIIGVPEANYLFQLIGFKVNNNNEFYFVDINTDIKKIEEIHKYILYAVNKIINDPEY